MKLNWLIPFLVVLSIGSGCTQRSIDQKAPQPEPRSLTEQSKIQSQSATPDLLDGSEQKVRQPHSLSLSDLRNKYQSTFLLNGSAKKREVALTFDDAPDADFTPQILDVLKKAGVKATFFVIGNRAESHPDIMKRIVQDGHLIGNHSYNHANLPKLSDAEFRYQINKTDQLIRQFTGFTPKIVRPPYGNISERQIQWLASQHKKIVNWNVDSLDWKGLKAEQVEGNILAHVYPGSIILQHAAGGTGEDLSGTVKALPNIISKLKNDGVKLVTITELLNIPAK
ncbi:polysaccharide deacetylase family protein [Paenibacillus sepulcri]|uniref:Polysaccharide deacetylase family protein n=1 Tax=Paenibacillus sepulcri TaxID=359917 RepID=A0ABS7BZW2_9BACL|nr:polysaccharide deacetylase family protein [Paenibacillus sepulcri]